MAHSPAIAVRSIGAEAEPLVVIDGFSPDPDALRAFAVATRFGPAGHYYPGLRAPLPEQYLSVQQPVVDAVLNEAFGQRGKTHLIDASFSIVTTPAKALSVKQRLPHCDALGRERIALVHYLSPRGGDGTAFFRHRATGFETIDETRAPAYSALLDAELFEGGAPAANYMNDDTALFERTALVEARYNRALLYRSYLLHSGAIAPGTALSPDPAVGRLTVTAFFDVRRADAP